MELLKVLIAWSFTAAIVVLYPAFALISVLARVLAKLVFPCILELYYFESHLRRQLYFATKLALGYLAPVSLALLFMAFSLISISTGATPGDQGDQFLAVKVAAIETLIMSITKSTFSVTEANSRDRDLDFMRSNFHDYPRSVYITHPWCNQSSLEIIFVHTTMPDRCQPGTFDFVEELFPEMSTFLEASSAMMLEHIWLHEQEIVQVTRSKHSQGEPSDVTSPNDDLMNTLAPLFMTQIKNALEPVLGPVISALQNQGEEERMQRQKIIAQEEKKLALKRERVQRLKRHRACRFQPTRRARAPNSSAKSSQLTLRQGLRLQL